MPPVAAAHVGAKHAENESGREVASEASHRWPNLAALSNLRERDSASRRNASSSETCSYSLQGMLAMTEGLTQSLHIGGESLEADGTVTWAQWLLSSLFFSSIVQVAVVLNAIQLGLRVDLVAGAWEEIWQVSDHCFTSIFAIEMVLKIAVFRKEYFFKRLNTDAGERMKLNSWNMLDFVIAWATILDTWILSSVTGEGNNQYFLGFQILRLLRLVKLLKSSRDLVVLIMGIASSMKSMMWIAILLFSVIYAAGIFFTETMGGEEFEGEYSSMDFDTIRSFGSLPRAMMTLFSICLLDQWTEIIVPIYEVQPYLVPFFLIFLVLTSFGLLNAIIGILVDKTTDAMAQVRQMDAKKAREKKKQKVVQLADMIRALDTSRDGVISMAEMQAAEGNEQFRHICDEIDLPPGFSAKDLYQMLDPTGHAEISREDFIKQMYRLIFCNDFHRQCLMTNLIAQVKKDVFDQGKILESQFKLIRQDIAELRCVKMPEVSTRESGPRQAVSRLLSNPSAVEQMPSEPKPCEAGQECEQEEEGKEYKESKYNAIEALTKDKVLTQQVHECTSKAEAALSNLKDSIRTFVSWHEGSRRFDRGVPGNMLGDDAGPGNQWLGESPSPQCDVAKADQKLHDRQSRLPSLPSLECLPSNARHMQRISQSDAAPRVIPTEMNMRIPHAMRFDSRSYREVE